MRIVLAILLAYYSISTHATDPIRKIAKANEAKELASQAFGLGDYAAAIEQYNFLIDSLGYKEEALLLNRAHAYFQIKDTLQAFDGYRAASMAEKPTIQGMAFNQLGVLSEQKAQQKEALSYYKEALRADPTNKEARYNYELLKKKLQEQEKQNEQNKDKNQQNQDQNQKDQEKKDQEKGDKSEGDSEDKSKGEDEKSDPSEGDKKDQKDQQKGEEQEGKEEQGKEQEGKQEEGEQSEADAKAQEDQKAKEGENSEMKPSTSDKLKAMNVSEEKAKQILEALRNKEAQYLQQTRKKATKKKDTGKPDW